jgi:secondary thiamine-phosphate synthase enzyme
MKSYRKELWFHTPTRRAFINITPLVEQCVRESGIREGLLLCNAMHITASVFINDDEPGLHQDFERWLEQLAPEHPHHQYRHNDTGAGLRQMHLTSLTCSSRPERGIASPVLFQPSPRPPAQGA